MPDVVRRIGLSLGADLCWPMCYEEILRRLELSIDMGEQRVQFQTERVTIEPFSIRQPCKYDLVMDRVTHWYHTSREWIKKAILMDDLYVFNNPWSIQSMEKQTTYCAMAKLGLPIPDTWMIPPKSYEALPDLDVTLQRYARLFDLGSIGRQLGYPLYMKPYDGGAWRGVSRIADESALLAAYEQSGKYLMHLQAGVDDYDLFVRCIGLGPQFHIISYDPTQPLHDRYEMRRDFLSPAETQELRDMTLTINTFFGWDFNSCEAIRKDGKWYLIDFANACPDSQVTSLHYHFPWLVIANVKWSLYVAATKKKFRKTLDWEPYYQVMQQTDSFVDRLAGYARIGNERMETETFHEFCATHLAHVDEVAWEFFGSESARQAVRLKVEALFPSHEVEQFTELFWQRIQAWREHSSAQRVAAHS
ncbi:MAG TPA: hypothetical protein PKD54_15090 [Pirellulaceae bacterium]|nr:hypothetical protein [Pirellulaceae bacterium]